LDLMPDRRVAVHHRNWTSEEILKHLTVIDAPQVELSTLLRLDRLSACMVGRMRQLLPL
jgi:hypothetical protein